MPYITTENVKMIRNRIKKEFPNIKFSVTRRHYSEVVVAIMESDIDFGTTHQQINEFYIERNWEHNPVAKELLLKVMEIVETTHEQKELVYDQDYGSVPNYYISIQIGKWDREYVKR